MSGSSRMSAGRRAVLRFSLAIFCREPGDDAKLFIDEYNLSGQLSRKSFIDGIKFYVAMLPLRAAAQPVDLQLLAKMAVSFIAGALIGLERERAKQEGAPGVRSVGFISLLGALTTALPLHLPTGGQLQLVVSVPLALSAVSVIAIYSYERAREERGAGVTTQLALALAYASGLLIGAGLVLEGVALCFLTGFALAVKLSVRRLVQAVTYRELLPMLELGVIVFLVGPLLPFGATDPFIHAVSVGSLYAFFVTVLALSFAGYLAFKLAGPKGVGYAAFFGGLANSEAAVSALCRAADPASVALLANAAMLVRNLAVLAALAPSSNPAALKPALLALGASIALAYLAYRVSSRREPPGGGWVEGLSARPIDFGLAARATALFGLTLFLSALAAVALGDAGLLAASVLGGLVSSSTVIFSVLNLANGGYATWSAAATAILLSTAAAVVNKVLYAWHNLSGKGRRRLALQQLILLTPLLAAALSQLLAGV